MQRDRQANFRMTRDEFEAAQRAKEIERYSSISDFVRHLIRADLRAKGLWPPQPLAQNEGVKVR